MVVAGLKETPRAGDMVRVVASEARARAVSEARSVRTKDSHFRRLARLAQDHYDTITDPDTGEETQCAPALRACSASGC